MSGHQQLGCKLSTRVLKEHSVMGRPEAGGGLSLHRLPVRGGSERGDPPRERRAGEVEKKP